MNRAAIKEHARVIGGFILLTAILTSPLIFNLDYFMSKDPKDSIVFVWNMWWVKTALAEGHSIFFTPYLFYPEGADLTFHTLSPFNSFVGIPFIELFGLIPTYNILILLTFPLSGYFMYLLGKYLTENKSAAFLMGLLFAFSSWHMYRMLNHLNFASIQFIPLYLLFLFKMMNEPTKKRSAILGIILAIIFYIEPTYAWFMLLVTAVLMVSHLCSNTVHKKRTAVFVIAGLTLFAILTLPITARMVTKEGKHTAIRVEKERVDLANYIRRPATSTVLPGKGGYEYLGIITLILAVIGFAAKAKYRWVWLVLALLALGISLGTEGIIVLDKEILPGLALPASLLTKLPLLQAVRFSRYVFLVSLAATILAGFGAKSVIEYVRIHTKSGRFGIMAVPIFISMLIIADVAAVPVPIVVNIRAIPSEIQFYQDTISKGTGGAFIDLPLAIWTTNPNSAHTRNMFMQMNHHQKMVGGLVSRAENSSLATYRLIGTWTLGDFRKTVRYIAIHQDYLDFLCDNPLRKTKDGSEIICDHERTAQKRSWVNNLTKQIERTEVYNDGRVAVYDLQRLEGENETI